MENTPPSPGQFLRDRFMAPLGVSAIDLARALQVPRSRLSEILSGRRSITVDTARRLGQYFGVDFMVFVEAQAAYDLAQLPPVAIAPAETEGFLVGPRGVTAIPEPSRPAAAPTARVGDALLQRLRAQAAQSPRSTEHELVETTYAHGQRALESRPK